ncbi:MAG: NRDE family protein [Planctomycetota bacterium]
MCERLLIFAPIASIQIGERRKLAREHIVSGGAIVAQNGGVCALLLLNRVLDGAPLFVGANRDEYYNRPSRPPEVFVINGRRVAAPRDARSGGTWIGVNENGVFVGITNRPGEIDTTFPSRGEIVMLALGAANAEEGKSTVEERMNLNKYNPFQLFIADRTRAFFMVNDGSPARELERGVHLLTNEHGLNSLRVGGIEVFESIHEPAAAEMFMKSFLRDHSLHDRGHQFCKHREERGTVSSTIIKISDGAASKAEFIQFLFAGGAPCVTDYLPGVTKNGITPFAPSA